MLEKPIIALMPGSRKSEVSKLLPVLKKVVPVFSRKYQFILNGVDTISDDFYLKIIKDENITLIREQNYPLLTHATLAILASGTVSLETAIIGTPQIVTYRLSKISYRIAKMLVKIKFYSLVNICIGFEVVRELIQEKVTPKRLIENMKQLLYKREQRVFMLDHYDSLNSKLNLGDSSKLAAEKVHEFLKKEVCK